MDADMQYTIHSFRKIFPDMSFSPDISLIFSEIPDISLIAVKFPNISRFSKLVVTLCHAWTPGCAVWCSDTRASKNPVSKESDCSAVGYSCWPDVWHWPFFGVTELMSGTNLSNPIDDHTHAGQTQTFASLSIALMCSAPSSFATEMFGEPYRLYIILCISECDILSLL